jgi:hypothetical protein
MILCKDCSYYKRVKFINELGFDYCTHNDNLMVYTSQVDGTVTKIEPIITAHKLNANMDCPLFEQKIEEPKKKKSWKFWG